MEAAIFPQTLSRALESLATGEFSAEELCAGVISRMERLEPRINSFITVREPDLILADAREVDRKRAAQVQLGALAGIPVGLKDCLATAGLRTTGGSRIFRSWIPRADASAVARLRAADAIIVGKHNMDELQDGSSTDNPYYGRTLNPWDLSRTSGGSSGGSAAAVAAGLCLGAIGTDAGGSVRMPAALCGVVGLKPTHGRIGRDGILPLTWTLADAGPIAPTGEDAFRLLRALASYESRDTGSRRDAAVIHDGFTVPTSLAGTLIGVERGYFLAAMEPTVREAFERALARAESQGARIVELDLPSLKASPWVENAILYPEAASVFDALLTSDPGALSPDVRRRLLSGRLYSSQVYIRALAAKREIERELNQALTRVAVIASPTLPVEDPGWSTDGRFGFDPDPVLSVFERCVIPYNISGLPAVSVPCGRGATGLPIGLQLGGPAMSDVQLLQIGDALREELGPPSALT